MTETAQSIIGLMLTVDRTILVFVLIIACLIAIAIVALIPGRRRWHEHASMGLLIYITLLMIGHLLFKHVLDHPLARVDVVSLETDR